MLCTLDFLPWTYLVHFKLQHTARTKYDETANKHACVDVPSLNFGQYAYCHFIVSSLDEYVYDHFPDYKLWKGMGDMLCPSFPFLKDHIEIYFCLSWFSVGIIVCFSLLPISSSFSARIVPACHWPIREVCLSKSVCIQGICQDSLVSVSSFIFCVTRLYFRINNSCKVVLHF